MDDIIRFKFFYFTTIIMNEQKYSKAKAFGLMTKRGAEGFLKLCADPYYSLSREKKDHVLQLENPGVMTGPVVRNMAICGSVEAIKTLLGQPFTASDVYFCGGAAIEGVCEMGPLEGIFRGIYKAASNTIKTSWDKAKRDATIK